MGRSTNHVAPSFDSYDQRRTASPDTVRLLPVTRKENFGATSDTFTGESSHWGSTAPKLVSLEVASQTPSITKRGFECMYNKSCRNRLTGSSLYFGPVSSLVRKSQRLTASRGRLDPDASIASGPRASTVGFDVCGDSTKKLLKAAPLISLEEAKQREVSRRDRAAKCVLKEEIQVEHEVRRLRREVAEIAWKKEQAKREEERLAHLKQKRQEEAALKALEKRNLEAGPTLTAAVAAKEDGLVVVPTSWIVPLISLDEARHTEKAKRSVDKSISLPPRSSPSPSAVAPVDSLTINAGNGTATTLQLVSLEEAAKRDRARRLEEVVADAIKSRTRMLAHAGTGLSHVPLITLEEAHKQDALQRDRPSLSPLVNRALEVDDGDRRALPSDASAPREKARWIALMSNTGNRWARPNAASDFPDPAIARIPTGTFDF